MADFTLVRPEAGQQTEIRGEQLDGANVVLGFPADEAEIQRVGDDLVLDFEDQGSIVVKDFYSSYTSENLPDFIIDGEAIPGDQFFAALGDDTLMPAAGPQQTASNGARYHDYNNANVMDGVNRLDGLDVGFDGNSGELNPAGGFGDLFAGRLNLEPSVRDFQHELWEDDPSGVFFADGYALTGSIQGDGDHRFVWDSANDSQYGKFIMNPDGSYRYELNNDLVQHLGVGDSVQETFYFKYIDEDGDEATGQITVTIYGTNDDPVIHIDQSDVSGLVIEKGVAGDKAGATDPNADDGGIPSVSGFIVASDVDQNDVLSYGLKDPDSGNEVLTIKGEFGTFTIDPNTGRWTYTLDDDADNSALNQLAQGETREEKFTVMVSDGQGGYAEQEVTITVEGTNDMPELSVAAGDKHEVVEDDASRETANGTWDVHDPDSDGDDYELVIYQDGNQSSQEYVGANDPSSSLSFSSEYGTITLNADGTYTYVLDHSSPKVQALSEGQQHRDTFTIRVIDAHGSWHEVEITVTIIGTNDDPVINPGDSVLSGSVTEEGVWGDKTGSTDPDAHYAGESVATGHVSASDVDEGDVLTYSAKSDETGQDGNQGTVIQGKYGTFTIDANGEWKYTLDNDLANGLAQDEVVNETFTITVSDGKGGSDEVTVSITITGTNDAPVLTVGDGDTSAVHAIDDEKDPDADISVSGTWTVDDADSDGYEQNIFITDSNGNDGTVGHRNDDAGQNANAVITTEYGTLTIYPDGSYTYVLNPDSDAVRALAEGETYNDVFTVNVKDAHGTSSGDVTITITITGTNDAPIIDGGSGTDGQDDLTVKEAGHGKNNVEIEGTPSANGWFGVKDVDNDDFQTLKVTGPDGTDYTIPEDYAFPYVIEDDYGRIEITITNNGDGTYRYDYEYFIDQDKADSLSNGDKREFGYTFEVSDSEGSTIEHDVNITVEGTNDMPELSIVGGNNDGQDISYSFNEDTGNAAGEFEVSGQLEWSDIDSDGAYQEFSIFDVNTGKWSSAGVAATEDGPGSPTTLVTRYGTLTVFADGSYTFVVDEAAIQELGVGIEEFTQNFKIRITDAHGAYSEVEISITITGENDAPVINVTEGSLTVKESGYTEGNVYQSGTSSASGKFVVSDVDKGDTQSLTISDQDGNTWNVTKFPFTITDDYGTLTVSTKTTAEGTIEYTYTYTINQSKADHLADGDSVEKKYTFDVSDAAGETVTHEVDLTIQGTNDKPTVTSVDNLVLKDQGIYDDGNDGNTATTEGGTGKSEHKVEAEGKIVGDDVDDGAILSYDIFFHSSRGDGDTAQDDPQVERETDASGDVTQVTITTQWGVIVLNTLTGEYTFTLNTEYGSAADRLAAGQSHTLTFTARVMDEHGTWSDKTFTIRIDGTNDLPELEVTKTDLTVVEDGLQQDGGKAEYWDVDQGDTHTYSVIDANGTEHKGTNVNGEIVVKGEYGTFILNVHTGEYKYVLNNNADAVQGLKEQQTLEEQFTIRITDNNGGYAEEAINVTIEGTNDTPIITSTGNVHNVSEAGVGEGNIPGNYRGNNDYEGNPTAEGQIKASDKDAGDTEQLRFCFVDENGEPLLNPDGTYVTEIYTEYGKVTLDPVTGKYTYELQNGQQNVNELKANEQVQDSFQVAAVDPDGNVSDPADVVINITGTNDRPEITNAEDGVIDGGSLKEDGGTYAATGSVEAQDVDLDVAGGEQLKYSFIDENGDKSQILEGKYGYIVIDANTGEYTYHLYNDSRGVQSLGEGEFAEESFTVRVSDGYDAYDEAEIKITIEGTDDKPVLTGTSSSIKEDGSNIEADVHPTTPGQTSGKVGWTDADANDEFIRFNITHPDEKTEDLGNGLYRLQGDHGYLIFNTLTGEYTYYLNNGDPAVDAMNVGDYLRENFGISVTTGNENTGNESTTGGNITITINGTNDAPVIDQVDTLHVSDEYPEKYGYVTDHDVDDDTRTYHFIAEGEDGTQYLNQSSAGEYGSIFVDQNGKYTYVLDVQSGKYATLDEPYCETFTITVTDPHGATTTEVIEVWVYPEGWEGGEPGGGNHGGWWHGTHPGEPGDPNQIKDEYDVAVKEDTNIHPDLGIIVGEGAIVDDSGNAIAGDYYFIVDGQQVQSIVGEYGTLYIRPDGTYQYVLNNDSILVQQLREGESVDESFTVYKDGQDTGITINVSVNGTNDAPEITSTHNHTWTQDNDNLDGNGWSASGTVESKDIDVGLDGTPETDNHTYYLIDANGNRVTTIVGKYGTITIDPNTGEYTYTINPGQSDLTADDYYRESFRVGVDDGSGASNATDESTINIDIRGTNNEPELTVTHSAIAEDAASGNTVTGNFSVEDDTAGWKITGTNTDTGASGTMIKGKYGYLFINEDGSWEYVLNNESDAVQGLGEGETLTENFVITVTDKHGASDSKDFNITINGTNDIPELFVSDPMVIAEGDDSGVSGKATVYDKDVNDTHEFGLLDGTDKTNTITNEYGTFTIDPNTGEYVFRLDNDSDATKALAQGQIMTLTYTIYVEDSAGALVAKEVTVTITGTNDDPIVEAPAVSELKEDSGDYTATGQVIASDPDNGAVLTYSLDGGVQRIETDYGTLVLNPKTGEYTYELKNSSGAVQALQEGEIYEDRFTVIVKDEHGASVETEIIIKIEGTNDDPVITSQAPVFNMTEDAGSISGQITATDVDVKDVLTFTVSDGQDGTYDTSVTGNYGTLTIDPATGQYVYELDDRAQALNKGDKVTETFWVQVDDGHGGYDWQQITVNITGENDAPVIDGVTATDPHDLTAVADGAGYPSVTGEVHASDVDSNAQLTYGVAGEGATSGKATTFVGEYGTVTINPDGTYTYTLHDGARALAKDQAAEETFTVIVTDEHGANATVEITVNVTGVNDTPIIAQPNIEITLGESGEKSGNIGASDVDEGDVLTYTVEADNGAKDSIAQDGSGNIQIIGLYGVLTVYPDGSYTYEVDKSKVESMNEGDIANETFKITVSDKEGAATEATITVTINGENDAPVVDLSTTANAVSVGAPTDETTITGQLGATDVDDPASSLVYGLPGGTDNGDGTWSIQGQYGTLTLHADGSYTYELDNSNPDVLRLGSDDEALKETFNFTVSDGHANGTVSSELNIDINSDNNVLSLESSGVLTGTDGDDRLFGSGFGEDQLYGGGGNDTLFAVGGNNNYLDGGSGSNQLYGGDGSDILVFSSQNSVMNGGDGVDFLVGVNKDSLDTMFGMGEDNPISNIEVMVMESMSNMNLTSLEDFAAIGINVNGDQVQLDDTWSATNSTDVPEGYAEYYRAGEGDSDGTTILVYQQSMQHGG